MARTNPTDKWFTEIEQKIARKMYRFCYAVYSTFFAANRTGGLVNKVLKI